MKKFLVITWMLVLPAGVLAQEPDTLSKTNEKKPHWLVGVDVLSALNGVSIIGGIEKNRSRYSMSLSHMWNSTRVGFYYDYYILKKYRVLLGLGFHNSFLLKKINIKRSQYLDSLINNRTQATLGNGAFLPNSGEVRHEYFLSASAGKEFKLCKGLFINVKISGLLAINSFYKKLAFGGIYGLQIYYKW